MNRTCFNLERLLIGWDKNDDGITLPPQDDVYSSSVALMSAPLSSLLEMEADEFELLSDMLLMESHEAVAQGDGRADIGSAIGSSDQSSDMRPDSANSQQSQAELEAQRRVRVAISARRHRVRKKVSASGMTGMFPARRGGLTD